MQETKDVFNPRVGMCLPYPGGRAWQSTPVFLPGEAQGQRSLAGYFHGPAKSRTWPRRLRTQARTPKFQRFLLFSRSVMSDSASPGTEAPCPSPCPRVCSNSTQRLECLLGPFLLSGLWNSPAQNAGVGSRSLLQIFPTQELNWGLLHKKWMLYQLSYQGSPSKGKVVPNAS